MKFTLSTDPKVNPMGARSCPQGFGRTIDVEPGESFDVYDVTLVDNPTFRDTGLFEPADAEAEAALTAAREAAESNPVDEEPVAPGEEQDPGQDPVLVAALQDAAERAEKAEAAEDQAPEVNPTPSPFDTPPGDATSTDPVVPSTGDLPPLAPVDESTTETPADVAVDTTKTARAPRVRNTTEA